MQWLCVSETVCVCVRAEGWLYTWLKGNIVAVESLLFLRDGFLYTKQPGERQVLNRQEAMLESVLAYRNASCVDDHLSRNDKLKAICALTWKSNKHWLPKQLFVFVYLMIYWYDLNFGGCSLQTLIFHLMNWFLIDFINLSAFNAIHSVNIF